MYRVVGGVGRGADGHSRGGKMTDSDTTPDGKGKSTIMRHVIREPKQNTAGFGVAHVRNPPPHETEYRVEQLWSNGDAEPVFVGDRNDALELIATLTQAIQNE
jgi:hypothetical protein